MHKKYYGFLLAVSSIFACAGADAVPTVRMSGNNVAAPVSAAGGVASVTRKANLPLALKTTTKTATAAPVVASSGTTNTTTTSVTESTRLPVAPATSDSTNYKRPDGAVCGSCEVIQDLTNRIDVLEDNTRFKAYTTWGTNNNVTVSGDTDIATTTYVDGAHQDLDAKKQDKLDDIDERGPFITRFSADNGALTVRSGEVTIPSGDSTGPHANPQRLPIWFE